MPTILDPASLKAKFTGQTRSNVYLDSCELYSKLKVHADGLMPITLIKQQRPNESDNVQAYRESIYEAETQNPIEKVLGMLEKIRRSPDWMIKFKSDIPAIVNKEETLEEYLTKNYPVYGDIEYWLFEEVLRTLCLDANAVVAVFPKTLTEPIVGTEYLQPVGMVFNSDNVIEFLDGDYALLKSEEYSSLLSPESQTRIVNNQFNLQQMAKGQSMVFTRGQVYYVVSTMSYQKWEETEDGMYQLTSQVMHNLGELPCFQIPGKFIKRIGSSILKKTPLFPMVPHLNKAARESNDLDAGVIMHLYLEKWRINNVPCKDCRGTGFSASSTGTTDCRTCSGTGMANGKSPFNEIVIKPSAIGEQNMPVPPVGYVAKDAEILKVQSERIERHLYKALAAIGVEHLAETGLNQSGTAKAYDREEINNLIYTFAGMLVSVANDTIYYINELRYKNIVQDQEKRQDMLPIIPVPEKFDVVSISLLFQEYQTAKTAGVSSVILGEMQKEIGQKKFYANPDVADFVDTVMNLDPFPDKTTEEKGLMESQKLAKKEDVVLSNYITDFVHRAFEEHENFNELEDSKKREILYRYAEEKVEEMSEANQVQQDLFGGPGVGPSELDPAAQPPQSQPPNQGSKPGEPAQVDPTKQQQVQPAKPNPPKQQA